MSKRILIVDDSKIMRDMVNFTLTSAGYQVVQAADGVDGLKSLEGQVVDGIITDVNMPNMDGITFATRVRAHPKFKSIPILMLTTEGGDDAKAKGRAAGVTGWITKPFNPEKLLAVVAKVCG